jgi:hypothetical protein
MTASPTMLARCVAIAIAASSMAACSTQRPLQADRSAQAAVHERVDELLRRYAANDEDGVAAMLDPQHIAIYGSDASEVVHSVDELRQLMRNDFALWGTASFGAIQDFDFRTDGTLATTFFSVPFTPGPMQPLQVRFSMTWRNVDGQWLLTQSANAVPTVGQSAADLLK